MRWTFVVAVGVLAGCGAAPATTPAEVVEAQADAVRRADLAAAHALLAARTQAQAPRWPETAALPAPGSAREVSRVARWGSDGEVLELRRGDGGWRISSGVLGLFLARTPEQALATFSRAILARDYAALHALLPAEDARGWSAAQLAEALEVVGLRERWVALAEVLGGGEVSLSWADDEHVKATAGESAVILVREGEGWKIFDVGPGPVYTRP